MDQFTGGRDLAGARGAPIGKTAVVVGAGIAGLTAAGALADWFEQVVVLDRDPLPDRPMHRASTPQSQHSHGLLVGGLLAQDALFPGIAENFAGAGAGAVRVRVNRDLREEPAHRDPMPQRFRSERVCDVAAAAGIYPAPARGSACQRHVPGGNPGDRFDQGTERTARVTGVRCTAVDGQAWHRDAAG